MTSFENIPIDVKDCKYFKKWRVAILLNKDGKIVTIDSGKKTSISVYDQPDECKLCSMNITCHNLHLSILNDKSAHMKKVWVRNAGKYGIAKTPLSTTIINLKKMSKTILDNLTS